MINVFINKKGVSPFGNGFEPVSRGLELLCKRDEVSLFDCFDNGTDRFIVGVVKGNEYALVDKINRQEIDTSYTTSLTCPFCGYADEDAWRIAEDSGTINCGCCDSELSFRRDVSVTYSAKLISHRLVSNILTKG